MCAHYSNIDFRFELWRTRALTRITRNQFVSHHYTFWGFNRRTDPKRRARRALVDQSCGGRTSKVCAQACMINHACRGAYTRTYSAVCVCVRVRKYRRRDARRERNRRRDYCRFRYTHICLTVICLLRRARACLHMMLKLSRLCYLHKCKSPQRNEGYSVCFFFLFSVVLDAFKL